MAVNREEFDRVAILLDNGGNLDCRMLGNIFGQSFWELVVVLMSSSKDAGAVWDELVKQKIGNNLAQLSAS